MKNMNFPPKQIILHTAAFRGKADVDIIRRWHMEKGWDDIGYHFVVTGSIYDDVALDNTEVIQKGRPLDYQGAHAKGSNNSIGICVTGHGDHMEWSDKQIDALSSLCRYLMSLYKIPIEKVIGHKSTWLQKLNPTKTCPGKLIEMNEIRKHITQATGSGLYKYYKGSKI